MGRPPEFDRNAGARGRRWTCSETPRLQGRLPGRAHARDGARASRPFTRASAKQRQSWLGGPRLVFTERAGAARSRRHWTVPRTAAARWSGFFAVHRARRQRRPRLPRSATARSNCARDRGCRVACPGPPADLHGLIGRAIEQRIRRAQEV
ncbi:MAG: hypothetical protein MZW92_68245 [Comamonadaceae bacterium]|nr:hypothetical protein [Comamonadaceae bacterium]